MDSKRIEEGKKSYYNKLMKLAQDIVDFEERCRIEEDMSPDIWYSEENMNGSEFRIRTLLCKEGYLDK